VVAKVKLKERNGRPMANSLRETSLGKPRTSTSKGEGESKPSSRHDNWELARHEKVQVQSQYEVCLSAFDVLRADSLDS
jgi:hypothetical protein